MQPPANGRGRGGRIGPWITKSFPIINPDVLGYIFEKYINQKQMGASGLFHANSPWLDTFSGLAMVPRSSSAQLRTNSERGGGHE